MTDPYRIGIQTPYGSPSPMGFGADGEPELPFAEDWVIVHSKVCTTKALVKSLEEYLEVCPDSSPVETNKVQRLFLMYPKLYLTVYPGA